MDGMGHCVEVRGEAEGDRFGCLGSGEADCEFDVVGPRSVSVGKGVWIRIGCCRWLAVK